MFGARSASQTVTRARGSPNGGRCGRCGACSCVCASCCLQEGLRDGLQRDLSSLVGPRATITVTARLDTPHPGPPEPPRSSKPPPTLASTAAPMWVVEGAAGMLCALAVLALAWRQAAGVPCCRRLWRSRLRGASPPASQPPASPRAPEDPNAATAHASPPPVVAPARAHRPDAIAALRAPPPLLRRRSSQQVRGVDLEAPPTPRAPGADSGVGRR